MWSILNYGRYKDKMSLPEVVLHDPDYFFWASDTGAFAKRGFPEARGLAEKARHIKIPKPDGEHWGVQYSFARTDIFQGSKLAQGPVLAKLFDEPDMEELPRYLDLSVVYGSKRYNKIGNERLLKDFKFHYFGSENAHLSSRNAKRFLITRQISVSHRTCFHF
jgi:hypothetical protein